MTSDEYRGVTPPANGMILCAVACDQELYPATWVTPFRPWHAETDPPPWFDEDWTRLPEELGRRAIAAYEEFQAVGQLVIDYMDAQGSSE